VVVALDGTGFHGVTNALALSPNGRQIAYLAGRGESEAQSPDGPGRGYLWIKPVDGGPARRLTTDRDPEPGSPAFSPDGAAIAFSANDHTLRHVFVTGGRSTVICHAQYASSLTWTADGNLVFVEGDYRQGDTIKMVPAAGGTPEPLVKLSAGEHALSPVLLPESHAVLFALAGRNGELGPIVAQGVGVGDRKIVVASAGRFQFLPSFGRIIYQSNHVGYAVPFDPMRLETTGPPAVFAEGPQYHLVASPSGTIAYDMPRERSVESAIVDRAGVKRRLVPTPTNAHVSPDGTRIAFNKDGRIWIARLDDPDSKRALTDGDHDAAPIWSRDGYHVTYLANAGYRADERILSVPVDGGAPATVVAADGWPQFWSAEGDLGYARAIGPVLGFWRYSPSTKRSTLIADLNSAANASVSPDGNWLAYELAESDEKTWREHVRVFVRPFRAGGSRTLVTKTEARWPFWSPDGRELFVEREGQLFALAVRASRAIAFGDPVPLPITGFVEEDSYRPYEMMPDGKSFLMSFYIPGSVVVVRDALRK
jgi:Tol biopolymer transport system component